jgi:hypothetical protein
MRASGVGCTVQTLEAEEGVEKKGAVVNGGSRFGRERSCPLWYVGTMLDWLDSGI